MIRAAQLREHHALVLGRQRMRRFLAKTGIHVIYSEPNLSNEAGGHKLPYTYSCQIRFGLRNYLYPNAAWAYVFEHEGIRKSMDGKVRWVGNAVIERWFRSLKTEYIYINKYCAPRELHSDIRAYLEEYNSLRPNQTHVDKTPEGMYYSGLLLDDDQGLTNYFVHQPRGHCIRSSLFKVGLYLCLQISTLLVTINIR